MSCQIFVEESEKIFRLPKNFEEVRDLTCHQGHVINISFWLRGVVTVQLSGT